MKKTILKFLVVSILGIFTTFSVSAADNKTTTGTATAIETDVNEVTDYVTAGSIMPYNVTPFDFGSMAADFNASTFAWSVTAGVKGTDWQTYEPVNGVVIAAPATSLLSAINIGWTTVGSYTVSVQEKSNPKLGSGCDGVVEDIPVQVIARPSIAWPATTTVGGCNTGAGVSFNILADVTGTDRFNITLSCTRTNLDASTTSILSSVVQSPAIGDVFSGSVYEALTNQTIYTLNVAAGIYGRYVFTIGGITDRISRKSGVSTQATDYPATTYTVLVYPTPTTGKIKHVANNTSW
jgi:hypothetical protein